MSGQEYDGGRSYKGLPLHPDIRVFVPELDYAEMRRDDGYPIQIEGWAFADGSAWGPDLAVPVVSNDLLELKGEPLLVPYFHYADDFTTPADFGYWWRLPVLDEHRELMRLQLENAELRKSIRQQHGFRRRALRTG